MDKYEKGGLLGSKVMTSEVRVDLRELTREIETACNAFEREGFEVVAVSPVEQGMYREVVDGGAGWSYTCAAIITARKA